MIKDTTRGKCLWQVKAVQVHLVKKQENKSYCPVPTERSYGLMVAHNEKTSEIKYFVSNAPARESLAGLLEVAFSRWQVEKWFERAKQECGLGAFEVRTYTSLIRHWLASRLAMFFLATQTHRLRGKKSTDHPGTSGRCGEYAGLESVGKNPHSWNQLKEQCQYYQEHNEASYASRRKTAKAKNIEFL